LKQRRNEFPARYEQKSYILFRRGLNIKDAFTFGDGDHLNLMDSVKYYSYFYLMMEAQPAYKCALYSNRKIKHLV
jgi:hypothetical protein